MPHLREWMLHYPADWTPPQAQGYLQDVTMALGQTVTGIMSTVGPDRASAILLTLVCNMARSNPVYHENIKDSLAKVYALIEDLDPLKSSEHPKKH